jgi:hypothetical protein
MSSAAWYTRLSQLLRLVGPAPRGALSLGPLSGDAGTVPGKKIIEMSIQFMYCASRSGLPGNGRDKIVA